MAQKKGSRQAQVAARASAAGGGVTRLEPQSVEAWRQECDRLRAELQAAREEIATLRSRQEQVLNRIDWVLDSLDSLPMGDA
jgi:uncharacterized coiled-coil DUF342 family protein